MDFESYFIEVWEGIPLSIVSQEYRGRNRELLEAMTFDIYRLDSMQGVYDPSYSAILLRNIFVSIQKIGIR